MSSGCSAFAKLFRMKGSVFPHSVFFAVPNAVAAFCVKGYLLMGTLQDFAEPDSFLKDNAVWSGFTFLVGFLVVFRTSQAYSRFWDGVTATHLMRAEWFDACSALCAFTRHSRQPSRDVYAFKSLLVRLFSILHAVALAEIEDTNSDAPEDLQAWKFELIDAQSLDNVSLRAIKDSNSKPELVFQWIQQLVVENILTGVLDIPPPILSRAFQELANGMVAEHEALKISNIPFPFPYAQTCDWLLIIHWLVSPFVVSAWVSKAGMAALFCFIQAFVLFSLNRIAVEIENPFGTDPNDLDGEDAQMEMNRSLALLISPEAGRTPRLLSESEQIREVGFRASMLEVWAQLDARDSNEPLSTDSYSASSNGTQETYGTALPGVDSASMDTSLIRRSRRSQRKSGASNRKSGVVLDLRPDVLTADSGLLERSRSFSKVYSVTSIVGNTEIAIARSGRSRFAKQRHSGNGWPALGASELACARSQSEGPHYAGLQEDDGVPPAVQIPTMLKDLQRAATCDVAFSLSGSRGPIDSTYVAELASPRQDVGDAANEPSAASPYHDSSWRRKLEASEDCFGDVVGQSEIALRTDKDTSRAELFTV